MYVYYHHVSSGDIRSLTSGQLVESPLGWVIPASNLTGEALVTIDGNIRTQPQAQINIFICSIL